MEPKLSPGTFYGKKDRSRNVSGIRLTECLYAPAFKIPRHSHETAYFGLVLEGSYTETYETRTRDCRPTTLLFHPAGEVHSERHDAVKVRILSIEFPAAWQNRLVEHSKALAYPGCFQSGLAMQLALRLYREFHHLDAPASLAIEGLTLEILAETCRQGSPIEEPDPPRWLRQVKDLLHDRFMDNLSLETLAEMAGVHPAHLSRAFRRHFRCTLGDYVRDLRIEQARHALAKSNTPLSEIALAAGYSDQSHFATAFKRSTGLTPLQFRKLFQAR